MCHLYRHFRGFQNKGSAFIPQQAWLLFLLLVIVVVYHTCCEVPDRVDLKEIRSNKGQSQEAQRLCTSLPTRFDWRFSRIRAPNWVFGDSTKASFLKDHLVNLLALFDFYSHTNRQQTWRSAAFLTEILLFSFLPRRQAGCYDLGDLMIGQAYWTEALIGLLCPILPAAFVFQFF